MPAGKHPRFKGWPRRRYDASFRLYPKSSIEDPVTDVTEKLPNLWIGGKHQLKGDWTTFQDGREATALLERRCVVCGEVCEGTLVLGRVIMNRPENLTDPYTVDGYNSGRLTDGPGGHPRCIWIAANKCPHFRRGPVYHDKTDATVVAFQYDGEGSGHEATRGLDRRRDFFNGITSTCEVDREATPLTFAELRTLAKERPLG